jgi:hypothetical protein
MRRPLLSLLLICCVLAVLPSAAWALAPVGSSVVGVWQGEGDATDPFGAHDGTLLGGAGFAPATSGQAFAFTADQRAVDIPDVPELYPAASFTIAGWIRTSQATGTQALIAHYECGGSCPTNQANSFFLLAVDTGKANGYVRDTAGGGPDTGGQSLLGAADLADGAFHHLAMVRDVAGAHLTLYVDGAVADAKTLDPGAAGALMSLDSEADDVYLGAMRRCLLGGNAGGCDGSLVYQVSGLVDDVVYWSRVVSPAEIAAIAAAGPNGLTTDATAPESAATAPPSITSGSIAVGFSASDAQGAAPRLHDSSGLTRIDLYAKAPGESAFAKVATTPGAATGSFTYTPAAGPGVYAFATVAVDAAGNAEALPAAPDAATTLGTPPAQTPGPVPTPTPKPADPAKVEQVVTGLPSTKACLSRRAFTIRIKVPKGSNVRKATVSVDGRQVAVRSGAKLTAPVSLKGLPKGRYSVKITLKLASGKTISGTRKYRTCAPKRR